MKILIAIEVTCRGKLALAQGKGHGRRKLLPYPPYPPLCANNVASYLSATATVFNLTQFWEKAFPNSPPFAQFINNTYDVITSSEQVRLVREPFYADYAATNEGRRPFVNPSGLARWAVADNNTLTMDEARNKQQQFKDWLSTDILPEDAETCP